jgi:phosphoglycerate dehydrogenase-like enzyme
MKAIYLVQNKGSLLAVYAQSLRDELAAHYGEMPILSKQELEEHLEELRDTEFIFSTWTMPSLTEDEIAHYFPSLRAVFYGAGSVQGFARPFLNRGIAVYSAWAANGVPVAEFTVAQIILANKGFFTNQLWCKRDRSKCGPITTGHHGNYGCCVGLIGCGMIGAMVAEMLKAYNLKVLAFDPFLPPERAEALGVEMVSLEEMFSRCAVVSNHLANNAQTRGMLNYELFSKMEPHATFINTGRGAQVVEADLVRALTEVPTRVAVLDVTDPEPPLADSPFYTMENVILTSHIAGSQQDEFHRMSEYMRDEAYAFEQGLPTRYSVTLKMLETMA